MGVDMRDSCCVDACFAVDRPRECGPTRSTVKAVRTIVQWRTTAKSFVLSRSLQFYATHLVCPEH